MAEYLTPGVYVEEYDNSPRVIDGVGTSTAGFVGFAEKGPVEGAPLLVGSYKSFIAQFGGYLSEFEFGEYRYLAPSVEQFFANGGTRCFVMRVAPPDAECASVKAGALSFKAKNPGKWGNRIQVQVSNVRARKMQILEKTADGYKAKSVEGFRAGDTVEFDGAYFTIVTIMDNVVTFDSDLPEKAIDKALVPQSVLYLANFEITVRYADQVEVYSELSFNLESPRFVGARMNGSELVDVEVNVPDSAVDPVATILENDGSNGAVMLEGGSNGSLKKVNAGTFIGTDEGPGKRTGIQAFLENSLVSMMAVPGITTPEVMVSLISHCENTKSRFAVLDMPKELYKTKDLLDYRSMIDTTYAAMYHPWVQVFDRSANKPSFIPPSGAVMGVYSRTDITRGVHKAPANEVVMCTGLSFNYTKEEQDILNPEGVNLIRALPGQGIRIWGARTASSNTSFRYVNVRRLFIYVEESIKANTNWVVFEPNDATLWQRVSVTVSSFLNNMWRAGMLAGTTPGEAYFVEIGPSTMSRDDIMSGRLICNIGIAPSRPAEFVIFRVTQHTAEAGSEE